MTEKKEQTEVVKIRLLVSEKAKLDKLAKNGERTFAGQVRLVVREWLEGMPQQSDINEVAKGLEFWHRYCKNECRNENEGCDIPKWARMLRNKNGKQT